MLTRCVLSAWHLACELLHRADSAVVNDATKPKILSCSGFSGNSLEESQKARDQLSQEKVPTTKPTVVLNRPYQNLVSDWFVRCSSDQLRFLLQRVFPKALSHATGGVQISCLQQLHQLYLLGHWFELPVTSPCPSLVWVLFAILGVDVVGCAACVCVRLVVAAVIIFPGVETTSIWFISLIHFISIYISYCRHLSAISLLPLLCPTRCAIWSNMKRSRDMLSDWGLPATLMYR